MLGKQNLSSVPSNAAGKYSKWLALALLMIVGLTNYMDRLSISILQVPIKLDLALSDTQLGAITGLSFSLVYTLAAIPIARISDRMSPKAVILVCLAVWNALTMLCGMANGFLVLAVLRMGVAIGEAGCVPAVQTLIATYFPERQRARAIAIWQLVFPLGTLLGIFFSGMLSAHLGWRVTFMVLGGIGLAVVPLIYFFLPTPSRQTPVESSAPVRSERNAGISDMVAALKHALEAHSFRFLLGGGFLAAVPLNAALNWNAPFYGRHFSLPLEEVTVIVALIAGVGGAAGMIGGGFISDYLAKRDRRWYCWLPVTALVFAPLMCLVQYGLAPSPAVSLSAGIIGAIFLNCWIPPQAAVALSLVRITHRATAAACILVTAGLGAAAGPFAVGIISDYLAQTGINAGSALATSIIVVSFSSIPAAILFYFAGRSLRQDAASAQSAQDI